MDEVPSSEGSKYSDKPPLLVVSNLRNNATGQGRHLWLDSLWPIQRIVPHRCLAVLLYNRA